MLEEMADGQMLTGLLISNSGTPSPTRLPWAIPSSAQGSLGTACLWGDTQGARGHWVDRGKWRWEGPQIYGGGGGIGCLGFELGSPDHCGAGQAQQGHCAADRYWGAGGVRVGVGRAIERF